MQSASNPSHSRRLAYLFERYPAFTQTFCVREIEALRGRGLDVPIFSIRSEDGEGLQKLSGDAVQDITYVPDVGRSAKNWLSPFAHRARRARRALIDEWGRAGDRNRAYEALWLGPKLLARNCRHIHVHFAGVAARTAYWLKKFYDIPFSITAHANDFFVKSESDRLSSIFAEAGFVITVSDYSVVQLETMFPILKNKVHRVYNGIDTDWFDCEPQQTEVPLIISVGRLIEKKGFGDLIEACRQLGDLPFRCEIIGEGPLAKELEKQIRKSGLRGKVCLLGPKTESEIKGKLAEASVFALACRTESDGGKDNLPTVIMEAMAAQLPVASTRLAGVPEMVIDGETGFLSAQEDPAAFAVILQKLLADPALRRDMGLKGKRLAMEKFDSQVTCRELLRVFRGYGIATP
jgi:colanic acid/amylovoran biosynthesis glycosyltransferase